MPTKTFWLEPTDQVRVTFRRFSFSKNYACSGEKNWGCDASVLYLDQAPALDWNEPADEHGATGLRKDHPPIPDEAWPTTCSKCGRAFTDADESQIRAKTLHSGCPDGKLYTTYDAPAGAMWDAFWWPRKGPDGISLCVKTPGGQWMVDSRASNCTRMDDNVHHCWVREGDPRQANVTVTKGKPGESCAAGAGSIQCGNYHGFLRNGTLT